MDNEQEHPIDQMGSQDGNEGDIGLINNESVQKIGENGHVEGEEDADEGEPQDPDQEFGTGTSSQGNQYQNNNFEYNQIGHQDAYG